jgi:Glycosyl hydrolases family 25/Purple acid Phosphatase, N-terminal domain
MDYVEGQTGVEGIVYSSSNYATSYLNWSVNHRTVWIANYSCRAKIQTANPPNGTGVWPTWNFWQYCSTGSVPGISGNCDLDVFNGTLTDLQSTVIGAAVQPTVSNLAVSNITDTSATVTWTTDVAGTTRVNYGVTSGYGNQSAWNAAPATSHSVVLSGLSAGTVYHYQAVSTNGSGSSPSLDQTFTTTGAGSPDVVVDNTDPGCTTTGNWTVGTTSTHIGGNYIYCSGVTNTAESAATATCRWTPSLALATYDVYVYYAAGTNRSTNTYWKITNAGSPIILRVNEQLPGNAYTLIAANVPFNAGTSGYVELMNNTGDAAVVQGDAVKFVYKAP